MAEIAVRIELAKISGFTLDATVSVSGAGNGAGHIDADFLFGQLANRHHVDELQEAGRLLDFVKQGLSDRRLDGKFLSRSLAAMPFSSAIRLRY